MKKIAILGSAPSSMNLAPFGDSSWTIWGCSPGLFPFAKRVDAWFEVHRWESLKPRVTIDYLTFMRNLKCPIYMIRPVDELPNSVEYPIDNVFAFVYGHMVDGKGVWREKRFERCDFASTISWMIAMAIMEGADEIGLWGVDMSATEEWYFQRSGCQSLIEAAKSIGIKVTVPGESDILRPPPLYGFCEVDPAHIKMQARKAELNSRIAAATRTGNDAQREVDYLRGALDNAQYHAFTWVGNPFHMSQDTHIVVDPPVFEGGEVTNEVETSSSREVAEEDDWRPLETQVNMRDEGSSVPVEITGALINELSTALANGGMTGRADA